MSSMIACPENLIFGKGSIKCGSQLSTHSSSNIPVTFERNENLKDIVSPGFMTFFFYIMKKKIKPLK